MKNFLQALAIIAIGYALYKSGWIEGFGAAEQLTEEAGDTKTFEGSYYEPESEPEQSSTLSRVDEEAMLAEFDSNYKPPHDCVGDPDADHCVAHRKDSLDRFRPMWKSYFRP